MTNPKFALGEDAAGNPAYGFEFADMWITDPTISECGRFSVAPCYYALTQQQADELQKLNEGLRNAKN